MPAVCEGGALTETCRSAAPVKTAKLPPEVNGPPAVGQGLGPGGAPPGAGAGSWGSRATGEGAEVPLNLTELVPVKPEPVMVTAAPVRPLVGVKPVMFGAGALKHLPALSAP